MLEMYLVGGAVRDRIMGLKPHDFDFTVVADSYESMKTELELMGVEIFQEREAFGTIRGRFRKSNDLYFWDIPLAGLAVDFVWARKEGPYTDGRRPDWVEPGSLFDDLARRDFTVNAIAMSNNGIYIDPFHGQFHIKSQLLTAVGDPKERLLEDALRVMRALRFNITKGFSLDWSLEAAMKNEAVLLSLKENIATDRIRAELAQCFAHDTVNTMAVLARLWRIQEVVFRDHGLWLKPTTEER